MRNYWLISDTHFSHVNILKFTDENGELIRGKVFSSVEEMDEAMIENWNSVVKPGDYVYNLGDVTFNMKKYQEGIHPRLNGSKRLIVGNHDDIKKMAATNMWAKIELWRMFPELGILMTHLPIHESGLRDNMINIHGHIHHNPSPTDRHRCVCVEQINYTPVNIDEYIQT